MTLVSTDKDKKRAVTASAASALVEPGETRQEVSAIAGGTVRGQFATVEIPPGALDANGVVRITPSPRVPEGPGLSLAGAAVTVTLEGASLVAPATVRLKVADANRLDPVAVARFSAGFGWDTLGGVVQGDELIIQTDHFSDFLVFVKKVGDKIVDTIIAAVDWMVFNSGFVLRRVHPPTCENNTNTFTKWIVLPADIDLDPNNRLRWCTQATNDDKQFVVRVRNNRAYAQVITLPGVAAVGAYSADKWTHTLSNLLSATAPKGTKFWIASGQQLDLAFEQPASGSATQRIQITPYPDISGTLVKLYAEKTNTAVEKLSQGIECLTSGAHFFSHKLDADVVPAAVEAVEGCLPVISKTADWLVLAKKAVTRVPDWDTDSQNLNPQVDYVVNAQRAVVSPSSTTRPTTSTTRTTISPSPSTSTTTTTSRSTTTSPSTTTTLPGFNVVVNAELGWQDSPVRLTAGMRYTVTFVEGDWTVDYRNWPYVSTAGYAPDVDRQIYQGCKSDPNLPYGVLLAREGGGPAFAAGLRSGTVLTAARDGVLSFRIHDIDRCLVDNDGIILLRVALR